MTSLEFQSDLCYYIVLFLANNGTVPYSLFFHSDSSAATSSARGKYGTVPDWPSRNEKQDSINVSKRCAVRPDVHFRMKSWIFYINSFFVMKLLVCSWCEKTVVFCLYEYFYVGVGISTLMSFSDGLGSHFLFASKHGKNETYEGRIRWRGVYFPPESASFAFIVIMNKILFPICTLTWRVNNYVFRQGKSINRRSDSTINFMIIVYHCRSLIEQFCPT